MDKLWFTGASSLVLMAFASAPAKAECSIQDADDVINVVCEDLDADGVSVQNDKDDTAINVDVRPDANVESLEIITPNGAININNSGVISSGSNGIYSDIYGYGNIFVENNGVVTTTSRVGISSYVDEGSISIINNNLISSSGTGVYSHAWDSGDIYIKNNGSIESNNHGVYSETSGLGVVYVENNGNINSDDNSIESQTDSSITVLNYGSITGDRGIFSWAEDDGSVEVFNSGDIFAESEGIISYIQGNGNIQIINTGFIDTSYAGIFSETRSTSSGNIEVNNAGTIINGLYGISSTVTGQGTGDITTNNSGTISADVYGISSWHINDGDITTVNSGIIDVSPNLGDYVYGIYSRLNGSGKIDVTNSGVIITDGTGIFLDGGDNNTVTHSGVVLTEAKAFEFVNNSGNTLNLLAPAFIAGEIDLGDGTAVNITTAGQFHSILWDFDGQLEDGAPAVEGPTQYFFNAETQQFATIDPTAFAASFDALGNMTNQLSELGQQGVLEAGRSWVTTFGSQLSHEGDGITLDRDIQQTGIAAGFSLSYEPGLDLGVMGGYINETSKADSPLINDAHDAKADGFFIGLNARKNYGAFLLDLGLSGGMMFHEQDRFVNDNLETLGRATASADFDSRFISPEIALSMDFDMGGGLTITPSGRLGYAMQWLDGYAEQGSNGNALVSDRTLALFEATAEIAAKQSFDFGSITGRIGAFHRSSVGDDDVTVLLIGESQDIAFGAGDELAGFAGINIHLEGGDNWGVYFDGTAIFGEEIEAMQGSARVSFRF